MDKVVTQLDDLIKSIHKTKTIESVYSIIYSIWQIIESSDRNKLIPILIKEEFYLTVIETVFLNKTFRNEFKELVIKEEAFPPPTQFKEHIRNIDQNKIINAYLHLSFFILSYVFKCITYKENISIRKTIGIMINRLEEESNYKVKFSHISQLLFFSLTNFAYLNKLDNFPSYRELDWKTLTKQLNISRMVGSIIFSILPEMTILSGIFKKYFYNKQTLEKSYLYFPFTSLYTASMRSQNIINYFASHKDTKHYITDIKDFITGFQTNNEKMVLLVVNRMTAHLGDGSKDYELLVKNKIATISELKLEILNFAKKNLSAFTDKEVLEKEWSNKTLLITMSTISVLETIHEAKNQKWKYDVFRREYEKWANEMNLVLNLQDVEDDFEKIRTLLYEENEISEWKSTFITPIKNLKLCKSQSVTKDILLNMIGMMNNKGGSILIGYVEHADDIVCSEIKSISLEKNGYTFIDIDKELEAHQIHSPMDHIKRYIQDKLRELTQLSLEEIEQLWRIVKISIKSQKKDVSCYLVECKKAKKIILVCEDKDKKIFFMPKRFNGRVENTDLSKEVMIQTSNP